MLSFMGQNLSDFVQMLIDMGKGTAGSEASCFADLISSQCLRLWVIWLAGLLTEEIATQKLNEDIKASSELPLMAA